MMKKKLYSGGRSKNQKQPMYSSTCLIIECVLLCLCPQWESRVTQYERDFDRIGMTVRKEVLRFEVSFVAVRLSAGAVDKVQDFPARLLRNYIPYSLNFHRTAAMEQRRPEAQQHDLIKPQKSASPQHDTLTCTMCV